MPEPVSNKQFISSAHNPRIKFLRDLKDRKTRQESGCILIEGYREILRAIEAKIHIEAIYYSPSHFLKENEYGLLERSRADCVEVEKNLFERIAYRDRPDGLLAVARFESARLNGLELKKNALILAVESVEKPGNLGTMLRTADAVACDAVFVIDQCTDLTNPNVVRASIGTLFSRPVVSTTAQEAHAFFKNEGFLVFAGLPEARQRYTEADFTQKTVLLIGSEQYGLSEYWRKNADLLISIPMQGRADSLNAAMAACILLFEAQRQRL